MKYIALIITFFNMQFIFALDSLYTNFTFPIFEHMNQSVKLGGDLNGDGYDDLLLSGSNPRISNIYFGGTNMDTIPDMTFTEDDINYMKIAYNGDLNGDGYDDLVISNPLYPSWECTLGVVWIYFGSKNFDLDEYVTLKGENYINGLPLWPIAFGTQIDLSGDFNNDGYNDLTVIAPGAPEEAYGVINIFHGGDTFNTESNFFLLGNLYSYTGQRYSIGDVNGDGYDDLAVSREVYPPNPRKYFIDIYPGSENGLLNQVVSSFESSIDFDISADFNGDDCNDIILGANRISHIEVGYGKNDYTFENFREWCFYNKVLALCEDMDNDGFDDFIVSNYYDKKIDIYTGSTNGLSERPTYSREEPAFNYFGNVVGRCGNLTGSNYPSLLTRLEPDSTNKYHHTLLTLEDLETGIEINDKLSVKNYELEQNYPNPFNPSTTINYDLKNKYFKNAFIVVYNIKGQEIWQSKSLSINSNNCIFDGSKFNSGIYYYSLIIDDRKIDTKSMVLIK